MTNTCASMEHFQSLEDVMILINIKKEKIYTKNDENKNINKVSFPHCANITMFYHNIWWEPSSKKLVSLKRGVFIPKWLFFLLLLMLSVSLKNVSDFNCGTSGSGGIRSPIYYTCLILNSTALGSATSIKHLGLSRCRNRVGDRQMWYNSKMWTGVAACQREHLQTFVSWQS